jgi:hypothetical protein
MGCRVRPFGRSPLRVRQFTEPVFAFPLCHVAAPAFPVRPRYVTALEVGDNHTGRVRVPETRSPWTSAGQWLTESRLELRRLCAGVFQFGSRPATEDCDMRTALCAALGEREGLEPSAPAL